MLRLISALLLCLVASACAGPQAMRGAEGPVRVGIIAFNDFHGNLEVPPAPVTQPDGSSVKAGGAAHMASAVAAIRARYAHSATVSAGDLIGASPLVSSLFLDEPTVGAMNRLGLDFNAVGNHEFDRGRAELLRIQEGGCAKHARRTPCAVETFSGARFRFLSASTVDVNGKTLFPATGLKRFGSGRRAVTLGFVGLTLKATPLLVSSGGVADLTFLDEADAINAAIPTLKEAGADAIVVLIHQGGEAARTTDPNRCDGLEGAILPILSRLDPGVDVVVSGHTHNAYVCNLPQAAGASPLLLTSAGSFGRMVTEIEFRIDPAANRVVGKSAVNRIVDNAVYPEDQEIADYVARYSDAVQGIASRPAGKLAGPARRSQNGMGGTLGNLIADAQLAATMDAGAQIALTNPFGIRAVLTPATDGTLTFAQIYAAQPFDNVLVTRSLTGAQINALLEQGVDAQGPIQMLAPSRGFSYCADMSRPAGSRISRTTLNGQPLHSEASYRVTVNSFLAGGGDGFTIFRDGTDRTIGGSDVDALEAWLSGSTPRPVPTETRTCADN